jgi:hypothetical protein
MECKANIAVKGTGNLSKADWKKIKSWGKVEKIWTCSGEWDWWIQLNANLNWDEVKQFVWNLRQEPWVSNTNTWYLEEIKA